VPQASVLAGVERGATGKGDGVEVGVYESLLVDTPDVGELPSTVRGRKDGDAAEDSTVVVRRVDTDDIVVVTLAIGVPGLGIALEVVGVTGRAPRYRPPRSSPFAVFWRLNSEPRQSATAA
jgi:hypothetical protein